MKWKWFNRFRSKPPKMQVASQTPAIKQPSSQQPAAPPQIIGNYRVEKTIGQGTYGKVKLATRIDNGDKVAIKVIEKSSIQTDKHVARIQREIRFLKLLNHPHIVQVYDVIETSDCIYIVMEYAKGGELFDYIVANRRLKDKEARHFFRQILSAVDYCHKNCVIHRDLKPENLLLDDTKTNVRIIDFGFGNTFKPDTLLDTFCGSPFYAAPEMILGKKYEGPEVDLWSLGVILFALLCGHLPFDDDNVKELYKKIATAKYKMPAYVRPDAANLIARMICVDPKKRATIDEVMMHPWVMEGCSPINNYLATRPALNPANLDRDIVNRLVAFGYRPEETSAAFSSSRPNPIRATYFLLKEMLQREEKKQFALRKKSAPETNSRYSLSSNPGSVSSMSLEEISDKVSAMSIDAKTKQPTRLPPPLSNRVEPEKSSAVYPTNRAVVPPSNALNQSQNPPEDIREVSGWFLNMATTSSRPAHLLIPDILQVLANEHVEASYSGGYIIRCNDTFHDPLNPVNFEIEVCKLTKMNLNGLQFKRNQGSIWAYKKLCSRLVQQMKL